MRGEPNSARRRICRQEYFNSLAPCGANRECTYTLTTCILFQLTRPVRGEPGDHIRFGIRLCNFNSLAPCGANLRHDRTYAVAATFQLTRPVRGEPIPRDITLDIVIISTHSPRAGRTTPVSGRNERHAHFNSLAPCGANQFLRKSHDRNQ